MRETKTGFGAKGQYQAEGGLEPDDEESDDDEDVDDDGDIGDDQDDDDDDASDHNFWCFSLWWVAHDKNRSLYYGMVVIKKIKKTEYLANKQQHLITGNFFCLINNNKASYYTILPASL